MSDVSTAETTQRPPRGIRLLHALRRQPDPAAMTDEELIAARDAENRTVRSPFARLLTGFPDRGAAIRWEEVALAGRTIPVRVHRPRSPRGRDAALPLVLHVHGGGYVGTAVQCDWVTSHLAARLPAVVVSVEHRLLGPGTSMIEAADDGWDVLRQVVRHPERWGTDPARTAVFGESAGAQIAALAAIRARDADVALAAQVLVNPCVDVTATATDYPSMREHADSPMLTVSRFERFRRLAAAPGTDSRALSPLYADDLSGLPAALVVVPTLDPVADHGRRYAESLQAAGAPLRLAEHPNATHAFLSMPHLVPQAKTARAQVAEFLRHHLAG